MLMEKEAESLSERPITSENPFIFDESSEEASEDTVEYNLDTTASSNLNDGYDINDDLNI